ncbi:hypothetical protein HCN44_006820 [Aphidius gifuensis]|uniref:Uncharacterized protein n=1 Tax=Aphidius gifuensis TaxID=684658 RepID=A0A834XY58_APHGI|nr:hypothetical protein HCN44_006820 [Aphidius gifuensis]
MFDDRDNNMVNENNLTSSIPPKKRKYARYFVEPEINESPIIKTPELQQQNSKTFLEETTKKELTTEPKQKKQCKEKPKSQIKLRKKNQIEKQIESEEESSMKKKKIRKFEPLTMCRKKCCKKINNNEVQKIHEEYWKLPDDYSKRLFMSPLITLKKKKSIRISECSPSKQRNRQYSVDYTITINSKNILICKGCFLKIFGATKKFIENVINKKINDLADVTGENNQYQQPILQKYSEEKVGKMREHILSYPLYESKNNKNKKTLLPGLTLSEMYKDYLELNGNDTPSSRWSFEREFYNLGLDVKGDKKNPCNTCSKLSISEKHADDNSIKLDIIKKLNDHKINAALTNDEKQNDKDIAKKSKNKKLMITIGIQKCMPSPMLRTPIFKKRLLWTYNVTCHNCVTKKSDNFMWHEGMAPRNHNQISSAIYNFIINLSNDVQEVTFYSDLSNDIDDIISLMAMFTIALKNKKTIKKINHKILCSGHTKNESHDDHILINKAKKKTQSYYVPRDYYNLVRNIGERFRVNVMEADKQFNFMNLFDVDGPFKKPATNIKNEKLNLRLIRWFQYTCGDNVGTVKYKMSFKKDEVFKYIDLQSESHYSQIILEKFNEPVAISNDKKKDLLSLLEHVDSDCHDFYKNLPSQDLPNIHPDIYCSTDDEN